MWLKIEKGTRLINLDKATNIIWRFEGGAPRFKVFVRYDASEAFRVLPSDAQIAAFETYEKARLCIDMIYTSMADGRVVDDVLRIENVLNAICKE